jgi:hypothetical protein
MENWCLLVCWLLHLWKTSKLWNIPVGCWINKHLCYFDKKKHADFDVFVSKGIPVGWPSWGDAFLQMNGPPMYIVSPNDCQSRSEDQEPKQRSAAGKVTLCGATWAPTFTQHNPEGVVLCRAAALAKRSHDFLMEGLVSNHTMDWLAVFCETPSSFMSYSTLLWLNSDFVVDKECLPTGSKIGINESKDGVLESSYTRSMQQRSLGPKALWRKVYHNLSNSEEDVTLVSLSLGTIKLDLIDLSTSCTVCVSISSTVGDLSRKSCSRFTKKFGSLAFFL